MQQIGLVKEVNEDFAIVEVSRKSSCEGCHSNAGGNCSACISFVKGTMLCKAENYLGAKVGDRVLVETSSGTVMFYAAAVFLFPLILAVIGYFAALPIPHAAAPYVGALLGFALAFFAVSLTLNRTASKRLDVRIIRVL